MLPAQSDNIRETPLYIGLVRNLSSEIFHLIPAKSGVILWEN